MTDSQARQLGRFICWITIWPAVCIASLNQLFDARLEWTIPNWLGAMGVAFCLSFCARRISDDAPD